MLACRFLYKLLNKFPHQLSMAQRHFFCARIACWTHKNHSYRWWLSKMIYLSLLQASLILQYFLEWIFQVWRSKFICFSLPYFNNLLQFLRSYFFEYLYFLQIDRLSRIAKLNLQTRYYPICFTSIVRSQIFPAGKI
jgi:hypothetical protein